MILLYGQSRDSLSMQKKARLIPQPDLRKIEKIRILEGVAEHLHGISGAVGVTPLVVVP